jgi:hypothetical protein
MRDQNRLSAAVRVPVTTARDAARPSAPSVGPLTVCGQNQLFPNPHGQPHGDPVGDFASQVAAEKQGWKLRGAGGERGMRDDPVHLAHEPEQLRLAARCGARTRSGGPCRSPAVTGRRRCRMHGGAPGSGGPKGPRTATTGMAGTPAEAIASRRWLRQFTRDVRALTKRLRQP